jgi:hypothetical protein
MNPSLKTDFAQLWVFPQPVEPLRYAFRRFHLNPEFFRGLFKPFIADW